MGARRQGSRPASETADGVDSWSVDVVLRAQQEEALEG